MYPHSSLLTAPFSVAWRGNRESKIKKAHGLRSEKINRWWKGGGGNLVDAKAITYTRILTACWSLRSSHIGRHVLFFLCPSSCCWAWCYIIWNTALGNLSQLWQLFSQLTGCRTELGRSGKKRDKLVGKILVSYQHCLAVNPKHSKAGVPMKKANSIPAMPSTTVSTKKLDKIHEVWDRSIQRLGYYWSVFLWFPVCLQPVGTCFGVLLDWMKLWSDSVFCCCLCSLLSTML